MDAWVYFFIEEENQEKGSGNHLSPTILYTRGWRVFIFPNEGNEPMHVHTEKGDADASSGFIRMSSRLKRRMHTVFPRH